jgi:hypothetical protein
MVMEAGAEAGMESFGSSVSTDEDPGKEVTGTEAAKPEKPVEPRVKDNAVQGLKKPIKNPEVVGTKTPAKTPTKEDAANMKAM